MSKVDELMTEIERLPQEEFTELVRWLSDKDWERWDKEIEADSEAGTLDLLMSQQKTRQAISVVVFIRTWIRLSTSFAWAVKEARSFWTERSSFIEGEVTQNPNRRPGAA